MRAPRGLDAGQLHFALFSPPETSPSTWLQERSLPEKLQAIEREIEELRHLSLVKQRPDGRLGLQDEICRIYARHIARDEESRAEEKAARQQLYRKLQAWAQYQHERYMQELLAAQESDERRLNITIPSRVYRDVYFLAQTASERTNRARLRHNLRRWEFEVLHYALLADPVRNINLEAFELADQKWLASDPDFELLVQAELWQVLNNPTYALEEFGNLFKWRALQKRGEDPLKALRRVARQEDVTNWLKRLAMRQEYARAVEFHAQLEKAIEADYPRSSQDYNARSWNHSFTRLQRALWRDYARVFQSEDIESTLETMQSNVAILEALLRHTQDERSPESGEYGFRGHPAETKLKRVTGIYHNYIGYGFAQLGKNRQARRHYNRAILIFREINSKDRMGTTINNLSRVLSDSGYQRARRVCLDGLALRKQLGAEVPIAYSYNTLALIDNDHYRPDLAWVEAAIAAAYFRKAEDARGLGLALLQLGEALRRLAKPASETYHLRGDDPERILETAQLILDEAVSIFHEHEEKVRQVEAWIERGCLERDRIQRAEKERKRRYYNNAINYLQQAAMLAKEMDILRLELDARVNVAWTHHVYGENQRVEATIHNDVFPILPDDCLIRREKALPTPERDDFYLYHQLSKAHGLLGRIKMEYFEEKARQFKAEHADLSREERQEKFLALEETDALLRAGAQHYTQAIAYAFLLSPTSSALDATYNAIYDIAKRFNRAELELFDRYCEEFQKAYQLDKLQTTRLASITAFLYDSFGIASQG